jgi:hypothetical protein
VFFIQGLLKGFHFLFIAGFNLFISERSSMSVDLKLTVQAIWFSTLKAKYFTKEPVEMVAWQS